MVSVGELGTNPHQLETELNKILDVAHSWGAVLLLDEADVFLGRFYESKLSRCNTDKLASRGAPAPRRGTKRPREHLLAVVRILPRYSVPNYQPRPNLRPSFPVPDPCRVAIRRADWQSQKERVEDVPREGQRPRKRY